jgi:glycosyltransferase involved in cell wall biosynthesis
MSALGQQAPLFSIILPVYNRELLVKRAIESCLAQDYPDFELIVVDDGSTDRSVSVAEAYRDSRISVVRHPVNRGVGPARNTGVEAGRGEWIVCLDSDDELLPEGLSAMAARVNRVDRLVDGVRFMCRLDSGALSPDPALQGEIWDYQGYVRWAESVRDRRQESLPCVRRATFRVTRYPETRMLESCYHLDFARNFRTLAAPDVVRLYHSDAPDQLTNSPALRGPEIAQDFANGLSELLEKHGLVLKAFAPKLYFQYLRSAAMYSFLAKRRIAGARYAGACLRQKPLAASALALLAAGMVGPNAVRALRAAASQVAQLVRSVKPYSSHARSA